MSLRTSTPTACPPPLASCSAPAPSGGCGTAAPCWSATACSAAPAPLAPSGGPPAVEQLARSLYEERRFGDMPVLADALEEAGCQEAAVLEHCRGPGPHVRGCWVLDLLLGKECPGLLSMTGARLP